MLHVASLWDVINFQRKYGGKWQKSWQNIYHWATKDVRRQHKSPRDAFSKRLFHNWQSEMSYKMLPNLHVNYTNQKLLQVPLTLSEIGGPGFYNSGLTVLTDCRENPMDVRWRPKNTKKDQHFSDSVRNDLQHPDSPVPRAAPNHFEGGNRYICSRCREREEAPHSPSKVSSGWRGKYSSTPHSEGSIDKMRTAGTFSSSASLEIK